MGNKAMMDPSQDIVRMAKAAEHVFNTHKDISDVDIRRMYNAYRELSDIVYGPRRKSE